MTDLSGRTALVTGASKGIGAEIAAALGKAGANVIAHYGSDRAGAEEATAAIPDERKLVVGADLMEPGAPERLWEAAVSWRGAVDVLVNNAAVMERTPSMRRSPSGTRAGSARCGSTCSARPT
jgi:NAD(P)-dependent dehydrogenase (short-subunit alcohol dehydrogenase family)